MIRGRPEFLSVFRFGLEAARTARRTFLAGTGLVDADVAAAEGLLADGGEGVGDDGEDGAVGELAVAGEVLENGFEFCVLHGVWPPGGVRDGLPDTQRSGENPAPGRVGKL